MSSKVDPTNSPRISYVECKASKGLSKPRQWFKCWVDSIREGGKIETQPSRDYCLEKWRERADSLKTKDSFDEFMQRCTRDCDDFKNFARWHNIS